MGKTPQDSVPPVVLDQTLYDLLVAESETGNKNLETLCMIKPNSERGLGTAVPLSEKYIIHTAQTDDGDTLAHLQLENCSHLLMFFAGPMNVVFVACEGETEDKSLSQKAIDDNAHVSFGVIQESQRPKIKTYANIKDFVNNHDQTPVRWGFAMDFAEDIPYLYHPAHIYELNSKRWLSKNRLRDAGDELIDCEISNCTEHVVRLTDGGTRLWYYGGDSCSACKQGVEDEIKRSLAIIKDRPLPFVLKLTQSLSAVGTHIVKSEEKRKEVLETIEKYLASYLPRITSENAYLHTTTLVVSDGLDGDTYALNFFIKKNSEPLYLGACHQLATGESGRQSTMISFADQEELKKKYIESLRLVGKVLKEKDYYGPVGADIMEDKSGKQYIIDLNVRTPLSLLLYLLKGHFYDRRGYGAALVYECVMLGIGREELMEKFKQEFEDGKIVLLGGTRLGEKKTWAFGMVVAGKDQQAIEELSDRIFKFET